MNLTEQAKQAVGKKAAEMVEDGMLVGLGTGTTSACFIDSLIERCRQGLNIQAVATSQRSEKQALHGGINIIDVNSTTYLDICFDGADEIDPDKQMIKGGGGALLREKIVASMSKKMIVMVDESKCVTKLGKFPLPIEIIPFGFPSTIEQIQALGFKGQIRTTGRDYKYITDSGHYIYDIVLPSNEVTLQEVHRSLINIPGVIETGLFLGFADSVIIGKADGSIEITS
ncbi:MAG: ribose-5-phosphate isomerase RpiA [Chlamydiota bacterium]|nr:ribose-5-phosphate isomerase RpiA [Chlamydiota bacterium]